MKRNCVPCLWRQVDSCNPCGRGPLAAALELQLSQALVVVAAVVAGSHVDSEQRIVAALPAAAAVAAVAAVAVVVAAAFVSWKQVQHSWRTQTGLLAAHGQFAKSGGRW